LRIALFHDTTGGAKRALYQHALELKARGHHLDLFSFTVAYEAFLDVRPLMVEVTRVDVPLLRPRAGRRPRVPLAALAIELINHRRLARACATLARAIDAGAYDVAFTHQCRYTHTPPILTQLGTPSVHFCQEPFRRLFELEIGGEGLTDGMRRRLGHAALARLERRALRAATRVLVNSSYSREYLARVHDVRSFVCYLGVDVERFRPGPADREPLVLSVGGLEWKKGHHFVVDALARIPPPARPRLAVIGDREHAGYADALRARAARAGVSLELAVHVSDAELAAWYARAAAVACAQVREPFGLVALEAMACATPVVAVGDGGLRETVLEGETGFLTPRDPDAFAGRVRALVDDGPLRRRLGAAGRSWVTERWTWARSVEELERHFHDVQATPR